VAASAASNADFEPVWIREVTLELSAQLRKANRSLRGSSVQALKHLILSPDAKGALDKITVSGLIAAILPVINNNDAHLLGPTLEILANIVEDNVKLVVTADLIGALCELLRLNVVGSVLGPLLDLVTKIGEVGAGQQLMTGLLQEVGISGDPGTVGKVIGTLLVASGASAGVTLDSFVEEAKGNAQDPVRASLALAVLGEAGLRLGTKSPLKPELFLDKFGEGYDKVSVSAAVALGRAGAGNVPVYLPIILKKLQVEGTTQYLLLQSIKEILQQDVDIGQYLAVIWKELLDTTGAEDNRAVCAECIGRLAIIDPETYVPKLDVSCIT
jgi:cullin-associated NEDD8-dissociated protein 1